MNTATTDKVVILARGLGTRMRKADEAARLDPQQQAAAECGMKALMPVETGRPFLDYVLATLADAGFRQVCLVIGPEHDAIRTYYGRTVRTERLSIDFAVQQEPRGTADAVAAAEAFAGDDPFVAINSDNFYPLEAFQSLHGGAGPAVALFERDSMIQGSNIPESRLRMFAVGQFDPAGRLQRILEKPSDETLAALPRPLWLSMNCWRFTRPIFDACRAIAPSPRGEFELPDAVQHMIDVLGHPFEVVRTLAPVLDLSSRQDVTPIARKLAGMTVRL